MGTAEVLAAVDQSIVHRISFWDALILAAAKRSGCTVLYTEDRRLAQGAASIGLEARDPFA